MDVLAKENRPRIAAFVVAITLILSNVLGFVRNVILARNVPFPILDAYYAAFRWPDLIFNVVILGAVATVLQPIFAEIKAKRGEVEAYRFVTATTTVMTVGLLVLLAVLYFAMPILGQEIVPYSAPDIQQLAISFSRVLLLSPLLFGISNIIGAVLNLNQRFLAFSLAPLFYNIFLILGASLYPVFGQQVLVWAVVAGALSYLVVQLPALSGLPVQWRPVFDFKLARTRELLVLGLPRMIGLGLGQVLFIVFTVLGSKIGPKSIAIFNLTNDFQTTPSVVIGNALATIVFPSLSLAYAAGQMERFRSLVVRTIQLLFFLLIPSTIALYVLRAQLTRLYLALGKSLGWTDTIRAIQTLGAFSFGIVFVGLVSILSRVLYAEHETKRPMIYASIGALISIIAAYIFVVIFQADVPGLAAAYALGQAVNALLLWLDIRLHIFSSSAERVILGQSLPKILTGSVVMAAVMWGALRLGSDWFGTTTVRGLLAQTAVAFFLGTGVYLLVTVLLKSHELSWLFEDRGQIALPANQAALQALAAESMRSKDEAHS